MPLRTLIHDRQYTTGMELGVWRGAHAFGLLSSCPSLKRLWMIDPWRWDYCHFAVPPETPLPARMPPGWYHATMGEAIDDQAQLDDIALDVQARALHDYPGRALVLRMTSQAARCYIAWNSLDFCYVDAIHLYGDVLDDLLGWWEHVKVGGIMSGDDFGSEFPGVEQAVTAFAAGLGLALHVEDGGFYWMEK